MPVWMTSSANQVSLPSLFQRRLKLTSLSPARGLAFDDREGREQAETSGNVAAVDFSVQRLRWPGIAYE
jgi:hypothetical protein